VQVRGLRATGDNPYACMVAMQMNQEDPTFGRGNADRAQLYQNISALSNDAIAIINIDGAYIEQNDAHLSAPRL